MKLHFGHGSLQGVVVGMALWAGTLLLAVPGAATGQGAADATPNRSVVEQKLKLLDSVLSSPKTAQIAAGSDAEAAALVAQARKGMEEARAALAAGDTAKAGNLLDQALRTSSSASSRGARATAGDSAQRNRNKELLEELNSYSVSLSQAVMEKNSAEGTAAIQRVDKLVAQAAGMTAANRHAEAGDLLTQALNLAVSTLSQLRAGQTVVLSLKFDTPADEYAYEQRRHQSNEMLIDTLLREGKVDGSRRQLLDRYLEESFKLRSQAEQAAKGGDYPGAIKIMEKANDQLMSALRASGLANF